MATDLSLNNSQNTTTADAIPTWVYGISSFGIILIVLAVVGNLLVIASYFRDKQLQTVYNMYILNLAVTDFLIGAVSMTFYVDFNLRSEEWIFGRTFCKLWCVNDYSMCLNSVILILLLSWDRVLLLQSGVAYMTKETKTVAVVKITISWILALGIYGPCVIFWDLLRGYSVVRDGDCEAEFEDHVYFGIAAAVFELTIPLIALCVLNCLIFLAIRKRLKMFDKGSAVRAAYAFSSNETGDITVEVGAEETTNESRNVISRIKRILNRSENKITIQETINRNSKDIKAAKSLAVLVIAFCICWAPYTVCTLISAVCRDCVNTRVSEVFTWLLWAKSSINPFLYASQSAQFKENFIKLLPFMKFCTKGVDERSRVLK